ncbi:S-layer homology domain-containing protein [Boudabousia tangfeifanii]|nr:S-layer homology domain-containing protein [Boudabousia tangfeifanii]
MKHLNIVLAGALVAAAGLMPAQAFAKGIDEQFMWKENATKKTTKVHKGGYNVFPRWTKEGKRYKPSPFKDVPGNSLFADEIWWAKDTKVTTGYGDGTFRPLNNVERQAVLAFLYRMAGSPAVKLPAQSPFKDVPTNAPFFKEIVWGVQQGITNGWPDKTFRPKEPVKRNAMAAFLYRLGHKRPDLLAQDLRTIEKESLPKSKLRDISGDQFIKEIKWLEKSAITTGYAGGYYRPLGNVHRDAMIAFTLRFKKNFVRYQLYFPNRPEVDCTGDRCSYFINDATARFPFKCEYFTQKTQDLFWQCKK